MPYIHPITAIVDSVLSKNSLDCVAVPIGVGVAFRRYASSSEGSPERVRLLRNAPPDRSSHRS